MRFGDFPSESAPSETGQSGPLRDQNSLRPVPRTQSKLLQHLASDFTGPGASNDPARLPERVIVRAISAARGIIGELPAVDETTDSMSLTLDHFVKLTELGFGLVPTIRRANPNARKRRFAKRSQHQGDTPC